MPVGMLVEISVAVLLAVTIGYCILLNKKLKLLHADRNALKEMVADLVNATNLANGAIKELKTTALEADLALASRLEEAEKFGIELASHVNAGQAVMERIAKIAQASKAPAETVSAADAASEPRRARQVLEQLLMRDRDRSHAA